MPFARPPRWQALNVLRGIVALAFLAHAIVRLVNGSVPRFGAFLEAAGLPQGVVVVFVISAVEIIGGSLLAVGVCVRPVCAALAGIVVGGIVLIHAGNGWFVGEHGVGGMEYSVLLLAALFVLAAERAEIDPAVSHSGTQALAATERPPA